MGYATAVVKCLHKVQSGYFKGARLTVSHQTSITEVMWLLGPGLAEESLSYLVYLSNAK